MFRACELKDQTYKKTRTLHFLNIEYIYTRVKILRTIDFELDTHSSRFSHYFILQQIRIHIREHFLASEFELNTNTYTSKISGNLKSIFPVRMVPKKD